jgi:hypothetical protein
MINAGDKIHKACKGGARSRLSPRSVLLLRRGVHRTPAPLPYDRRPKGWRFFVAFLIKKQCLRRLNCSYYFIELFGCMGRRCRPLRYLCIHLVLIKFARRVEVIPLIGEMSEGQKGLGASRTVAPYDCHPKQLQLMRLRSNQVFLKTINWRSCIPPPLKRSPWPLLSFGHFPPWGNNFRQGRLKGEQI